MRAPSRDEVLPHAVGDRTQLAVLLVSSTQIRSDSASLYVRSTIASSRRRFMATRRRPRRLVASPVGTRELRRMALDAEPALEEVARADEDRDHGSAMSGPASTDQPANTTASSAT